MTQICPYCLEEAKTGARKCPHCQSNLSDDPPTAETAVYVLDKGLIRFGKFVGAVLAIFILVGVYLFGYDIKQSSEKTTEAKLAVEATSIQIEKQRALLAKKIQEIETQIARIEQLEREVAGHREETSKATKDVRKLLSEVRSRRAEADAILVEMRTLGTTEAAIAVTRRGERGITAERGRLWEVGTELRFRFLDGDKREMDVVRAAIQEWGRYVNLTFVERDVESAEIRISFSNGGSWSYIGTDALGVTASEPTLNYGFLYELRGEDAMQSALHEFGHTLGLVHEFQNPSAGEIFDRDTVIDYYSAPPYSWSNDQIEFNVLRKIDAYPGSRPYDPESIMNYELPPELFVRGMETRPLQTLSESDKLYVASLYPGDSD